MRREEAELGADRGANGGGMSNGMEGWRRWKKRREEGDAGAGRAEQGRQEGEELLHISICRKVQWVWCNNRIFGDAQIPGQFALTFSAL